MYKGFFYCLYFSIIKLKHLEKQIFNNPIYLIFLDHSDIYIFDSRCIEALLYYIFFGIWREVNLLLRSYSMLKKSSACIRLTHQISCVLKPFKLFNKVHYSFMIHLVLWGFNVRPSLSHTQMINVNKMSEVLQIYYLLFYNLNMMIQHLLNCHFTALY